MTRRRDRSGDRGNPAHPAAGDGHSGVWLTSYPVGVVERIDPATNTVVFHTEPGGTLNGIAEGFGSIWVAVTGSKLLYRFDPAATSTDE